MGRRVPYPAGLRGPAQRKCRGLYANAHWRTVRGMRMRRNDQVDGATLQQGWLSVVIRFSRPAFSRLRPSRDSLPSSQAAHGPPALGWIEAEPDCCAIRPRHRAELEKPCVPPIARQPTARTPRRRQSNFCGAAVCSCVCPWIKLVAAGQGPFAGAAVSAEAASGSVRCRT